MVTVSSGLILVFEALLKLPTKIEGQSFPLELKAKEISSILLLLI